MESALSVGSDDSAQPALSNRNSLPIWAIHSKLQPMFFSSRSISKRPVSAPFQATISAFDLMSKTPSESTELQSDSNSESLDSGVGLVDRTQQLLDEVDQLLGPGMAPVKSTSSAEDSKSRDKFENTDLGDSVETLKNFLKEINDDPADDLNDESPALEIQSEECGLASGDEADQDDDRAEVNCDAVTCDEEPDAAESNTKEPEAVDPIEDPAESDCGFDVEALRRAFDEDDENSDAELNDSADDTLTTSASPEGSFAENLESDEEGSNDESQEVEKPASEAVAERLDHATDASVAHPQMPAVSGLDDRISMMESSMDSMFQHLEHRILDMFQNLTEQIKTASAAPVDQVRFVESDSQPEQEEEQDSLREEPNFQLVSETPAEDKGDSDKVSELKEQLTSKLREAEIELSINRAKLSQQRAKIEQMQADLDRREAVLEDKLEQAKKMGLDKKKGLLDRWKRHMGDEQ